jgi:uncharacterized damage-inducible protein DinB
MMNKPTKEECKPYFHQYIDLVPNEDYYTSFEANTLEVVTALKALPLEKHNYAYAEGKWTVKQLVMHIIDVERIFAYRILVILRNDTTTTLQGFDEDDYADNAKASNRTLASVIEEFEAVRKSTYLLLADLDDSQSKLVKDISGTNISVRAIAYTILGHAKHHLNILEERYL